VRQYPNVPPNVGLAMQRASLVELDQMGMEDMHDLIEVILTDAHNARAMARKK
jgi:hypothetical protein